MVAFNKVKGGAQKEKHAQYEVKTGENRVRLVGGVIPRYVYWVKGTNGKNLPIECLAYDREAERFLNKEKDWVKEFFPDMRCNWAYAANCINLETGEVEIFNFKKTLWTQIVALSDDLGDPTDPEEGWDIVFKKEKTGPNPMNVAYTLMQLKCSKGKRPLTDEEKAAVAAVPTIEEKLPRPTEDAQKSLLEQITSGEEEKPEEAVDTETLGEDFELPQ